MKIDRFIGRAMVQRVDDSFVFSDNIEDWIMTDKQRKTRAGKRYVKKGRKGLKLK